MLRRVITLALALMLSWTGFSGHEAALPVVTADAAIEFETASADENAPGTVDDHHLDDIPVRASLDLQDAQDLASLIPHRFACGSHLCLQQQAHASEQLPEPWLGQPQRPPRAA